MNTIMLDLSSKAGATCTESTVYRAIWNFFYIGLNLLRAGETGEALWRLILYWPEIGSF